MTERGKDPKPFDEQAALGELERFRADIERYRRQRESVADDFEQFVRSFPSPVDVFPSEENEPPPPAPRATTPASHPAAIPFSQPVPSPESVPSPQPVSPPQPAPQASAEQFSPEAPAQPLRPAPAQPLRPAPPPVAAPAEVIPLPPVPSVLRAEPPTRTPPLHTPAEVQTPARSVPVEVQTPARSKTPLLLLFLLVLLAAGAFGFWSLRQRAARLETSAPPVSQQAPAAAPADPVTTPAAPPAAAVVPDESEITTVRPAWVRLIADGERVFERELPAGTRVPFKAENTIVIRTGDAGAVRVSIRGQDQGPLGRDGEVVTRSFTVSARPAR